ncbi:hypothetical protein MBT42_00340 [Streptomyces sp. MBT42]|uniref:hypothetical protein n=1 Tax=Streptomyces sp. MBT42 TaxID=1488373 RepID=UPI001E3AD70F|nr:hypothetical protein [Streptomyces sp. MBT42]MCD2462006.1 hypothetical protein [Streptomyces sp. MBT42]
MGTLLAGIAALVSIFTYGSSSPARGTAPGERSQTGAAPSASRETGPSASEDTGPASPSANPSTPTSSPPAASASPRKPPTPRTAQFDLVQGYGFSLNDDPLRPGETGPQGQGFEVHWDDFFNALDADQGAKLIKDGSKSLADCKKATRFEDSLNEYLLVKGDGFCVISATGAVGLVEVTGLEPGTYFGLKVTVLPASEPAAS